MGADTQTKARPRRIALASRGGTMAAYELGPEDRPVDLVFSHANGFNARTYLSLLAPVAVRRRILAIDLRGHGLTELPPGAPDRTSWDDIGQDLLALLRTEDLSGVTLSGHSMGATTSILAAAEAPERVRDLVLFDPVIIPTVRLGEPTDSPLVKGALRRRADFPDRAAALASYAGRGPFAGWTPQALADYVQDGFRDLPGGGVTLSARPQWEHDNYIHQAHDTRGALARTRCPVRILKAGINSTCALDAAELESLAPGRGRIEVVAGATHFLPMERPDVVAGALLADG
jgi:pimeloyl-ACP methyl ester carboxylesterase